MTLGSRFARSKKTVGNEWVFISGPALLPQGDNALVGSVRGHMHPDRRARASGWQRQVHNRASQINNCVGMISGHSDSTNHSKDRQPATAY